MAPFEVPMTLAQVRFVQGCIQTADLFQKGSFGPREAGQSITRLAGAIDPSELANLGNELAKQTHHES